MGAEPARATTTGVAPGQAADPLILTIDVGTSSVRAMLFDGAGRAIQGLAAHEAHQMENTADGGVQTDAETLLARVGRCLDGALQSAGPLAARIAAVAPTTFWHNVLGASRDGTPRTPVFTWADTRSARAAEDLRKEMDQEQMHRRTGCLLHPSYLPAKLRWLQGGRRYGRPAIHPDHWLSFAEFMILRFFSGGPVCSISMASGTGLLDQHRCTWDAEVLAAIPVQPERLSPLDDSPRRGLRPELARRWPALAQVPWYPGWGDGATNNTGCGALTRQRVAMMVGTSAAMRTAWRTQRVTIPPKLWCYRIDAARVVVGGALSNGGNLIDWLHATLALPSQDEREAALAAMEPDSHGLTFLPFLAGERSPNWESEARATISGLTLHSKPLEILRAGHEAVAYRLGLIYELLHRAVPQAGHAPEGLIASGGALLHAPFWLQMMADALGRTVTASAVPEASSRGAALLALEALGALPHLDELPPPLGEPYHPDRARTRRYRAASERQRALYELLIARHGAP